MQKLVLTDDEFMTIRNVLGDWGLHPLQYSLSANPDKVNALKKQFTEFYKLDFEIPEMEEEEEDDKGIS